MPPAPPINAVSVCRLLVCISFIGRQKWNLCARVEGNYKSPQLVFRLNVNYFSPLFSNKQVLPMSSEAVSNIPCLGFVVSWFLHQQV